MILWIVRGLVDEFPFTFFMYNLSALTFHLPNHYSGKQKDMKANSQSVSRMFSVVNQHDSDFDVFQAVCWGLHTGLPSPCSRASELYGKSSGTVIPC